ncbi:MAG: YbaY family lipoprotein [Methylotetracoccus sp.]
MRSLVITALAVVFALPIASDASAATVSGTASYRERIALPPDATFEVTLEDVSLADAPAELIGNLSATPAGQVPIRFDVSYNEGDIKPNHQYAVRARITRAGVLLWTTTRRYPVLTMGAGNRVNLLLERVVERAASTAPRSITETYWKLTELNGAPVNAPRLRTEPHLILQSGSRLVGSGGCNRMLGTYTLDGAAIAFGPVASTEMACPDGMELESAFFRTLPSVRAWKIDGDRLEFKGSHGESLAGFVAVDLK